MPHWHIPFRFGFNSYLRGVDVRSACMDIEAWSVISHVDQGSVLDFLIDVM